MIVVEDNEHIIFPTRAIYIKAECIAIYIHMAWYGWWDMYIYICVSVVKQETFETNEPFDPL